MRLLTPLLEYRLLDQKPPSEKMHIDLISLIKQPLKNEGTVFLTDGEEPK